MYWQVNWDRIPILPLDQLAFSLQCGFSSTVHGNDIAVAAQRIKLGLVIETSKRFGVRGIGFSNATGRPKKRPEKAPGRARRGPKYASLGGFSTQSGRLQAWGWRVGRSLNGHGAHDCPGLRVDPGVGMACRHSAQRHRRLQGSRSPWRQVSDSVSGSSSEVQPRLARPALGRRLRVQAQVAQDLLDHRPLQDGGDDLELPGAAVRAALHIDIEHPLEQPRPTDACGPNLGGPGFAAA